MCVFIKLSGATKWSSHILHISCPNPRINHFSKEPWYLWLENSTRNQDLGVKYTPYHLDIIASRPFQLIKKIYMHLFLSLSIYMYVCTYIYIFICFKIYREKILSLVLTDSTHFQSYLYQCLILPSLSVKLFRAFVIYLSLLSHSVLWECCYKCTFKYQFQLFIAGI